MIKAEMAIHDLRNIRSNLRTTAYECRSGKDRTKLRNRLNLEAVNRGGNICSPLRPH